MRLGGWDGRRRYRNGLPRPGFPARLLLLEGRGDDERTEKRGQKLKPLADQTGCTLSQFALAWILREPNVASAIVGASRPEQLDENAAASGKQIDPALFRKAEAIVAGVGEGA